MKKLSELLPKAPEGKIDLPRLDVAYNCDVCQDRGVVKFDVAVTTAHFGKLFPCPADCEAVQRTRAERAKRMINGLERKAGSASGLYLWHPNNRNQRLTMENIKSVFQQSGSQRLAWELVSQFINSAPEAHIIFDDKIKPSLVLYGDKGYGKTLLASAAVNSLQDMGIPVWGGRLLSMVKRVNDTYQLIRTAGDSSDNRPEFSASEIVNAFGDFPVLVIDEFEISSISKSRMDVVETIINARYIRGLSTIITTNLNQDGIRRIWNERIADRIIDSFWFWHLSGERLRDDSSEIILE